MNIQFEITSPNNCDHWHIKAISPKGERTFVFTKQDLQIEPDDIEAMVKFFIRHQMQDRNISSLAQVKNWIEGKTFRL